MRDMHFQFDSILVPVDFSVNTRVAIDKALKLCEGEEPVIHLLYVIRNPFDRFSSRKSRQLSRNAFEKRIELLAGDIRERRPDIRVLTEVICGESVERSIIMRAKSIGASLVIIGKHSRHSLFPFLNSVAPSRVAGETHVPVLTVKPGSLDSETKTVVVPIGKEIDNFKLQIMEALCRKARIHIHLLAFVENGNKSVDTQAGSFLSTFDWVKRNLHCPMKYGFIYGDNKAKALLKYCRSVNADLLLVTPVSETRIGWMNTHISDVLPAESKTQVLSVQSLNF